MNKLLIFLSIFSFLGINISNASESKEIKEFFELRNESESLLIISSSSECHKLSKNDRIKLPLINHYQVLIGDIEGTIKNKKLDIQKFGLQIPLNSNETIVYREEEEIGRWETVSTLLGKKRIFYKEKQTAPNEPAVLERLAQI